MAGYNGRKPINVSRYVADLNAISPVSDVPAQQENDSNIEDDLARFTNTEFFDFDFLDASQYDPGGEERARRDNIIENGKFDAKGMDFGNDAFQFTDVPSYIPNQTSASPTALPNTYTNILAPTYPSPAFPSATSSIAFNPAPYPGQKRRLSTSPAPTSIGLAGSQSQEPETAASRMAAEEDKRRRNTAASARFRVKKKQREQALESTAKELENKVGGLEQRIGQLEAENDFLRGLVVARDGGDREELRGRWEMFGNSESERKGSEGKKGVGTEDSKA